MKYFVEHRITVRRAGRPRLIPLSEIYNHVGFRSVFAYPEHVANEIQEHGHTRNIAGRIEVYSDELLIDCDDFDPVQFREWLKGSGLAYEEYTSGNRSIHFHIPLVPMSGAEVPYAQKQWVEKHCPGADVSFYHSAGQYRLPGTFHPKNPGHCKHILARQDGDRLKIRIDAEAKRQIEIKIRSADSEITSEKYMINLTKPAGPGERSPHIWLLATQGLELGKDDNEIIEDLQFWNSHFATPPHSEKEIHRQFNNALTRLGRRGGI